jgi:hypothetical protein
MVQDDAVERFRSVGKSAGRPAVTFAWHCITTRVVVGENDSGAAVLNCVSKDCPDRKAGAGFIAFMVSHMQAPSLVIDMRYPQAFDGIGVIEVVREKAARCLQPVEPECMFGALKHGGTGNGSAGSIAR